MQKRYLIDHRILFLFGYIFYLFTPYIVGKSNWFDGYPGIDLFQGVFNLIPDKQIGIYLIVTLAWLPAFYLGHFLFEKLNMSKVGLQKFNSSELSLSIPVITPVFIFILFLFAFLARNSLLGGYSSYDVGARGKMSTLLVLFNFFMIYQLVSRQKISYLFIAGIVMTAFLLLSMGGRMYVFETFIIMLIYKTSFSVRSWSKGQIFLFGFVCFIIGSAFGLWRMGSSLGLEAAAYSFFAEPTFTWFSTISFLTSNEIQFFNWPSNFLTSFLNLIPNTIISLKPYIVSLERMAVGYKNPLGADSAWSTFVINFGSVGSCFFILFTGFMLNYLRYKSTQSRFWATYYIMVCGMIPFQFFRDGFYILNKQLFFNFLLLPCFILLLLKTMLYLQKRWILVNQSVEVEINKTP